MPKKMTDEQRLKVLEMLAQGQDRDTIAASVGVTPGQVSAIAAHVKMGTYELPDVSANLPQVENQSRERTSNLLGQLRGLKSDRVASARLCPMLLGMDAESHEQVYWNPDPENGSANPHVLILGESGFGKTYTISCLLVELARQGIHSIVFDYGQGFALDSAPPDFTERVNPVEIQASREGIGQRRSTCGRYVRPGLHENRHPATRGLATSGPGGNG
jgi:hypothetical protein